MKINVWEKLYGSGKYKPKESKCLNCNIRIRKRKIKRKLKETIQRHFIILTFAISDEYVTAINIYLSTK